MSARTFAASCCAIMVAAFPTGMAEDLEKTWTVTYNAPVPGAAGGVAVAAGPGGRIFVLASVQSLDTDFDYLALAYDGQGTELWRSRFDGNGRTDTPRAMRVDSEGSVVVTGSSVPIDTSADIVTIKYDATGREVWRARYDGVAGYHDDPADLEIDADDDVIVAGTTSTRAGGRDVLLIKYGPGGNTAWTVSTGGSQADEANDAAIDAHGDVYVTGHLGGNLTTWKLSGASGAQLWSAPGDRGDGWSIAVDAAGGAYVSGIASVEGDELYVTIRYDGAGSEVWRATYPKSGFQVPRLAIDPLGAAYVVPESFAFDLADEYLILKYDADGKLAWDVRGSSGATTGISLDGDGGVLVSGWGDAPGIGTQYTVARYDAATGAPRWTRAYDGPSGMEFDDYAAAIASDPAGKVVVTGISRQRINASSDFTIACATILFDPDGKRLWVARETEFGNGSDWLQDLLIDPRGNIVLTGAVGDDSRSVDLGAVRIDPAGNLLGAVHEGTPGGYEMAFAAATDPAGNLYVTGHSSDLAKDARYLTVKYDPDLRRVWTAAYLAGAAGRPVDVAVGSDGSVVVAGMATEGGVGEDWVTMKYDATGENLWTTRFDGGGADERPTAMALGPDGNVLVNGLAGRPAACVTVCYAPDGRQLWAATHAEGDLGREASAIAVDAAGGVIVAAKVRNAGQESELDCATVKYDPSGRELWARRVAGAWNAPTICLALDSAGNAYLAGVGGRTIKYDPDGELLWSVERADAEFTSLALDGRGSVFVAGSCPTQDPGYYDPVRQVLLVQYDSAGRLVAEGKHPIAKEWTFETGRVAVGTDRAVYVAGQIGLTPWVCDYLLLKFVAPAVESRFLRGDCNDDGILTIADATFHLEASFITGMPLACEAACDSNGDGKVHAQVADPIYVLRFLFLGGRLPPSPFPICGSDAGGALGCEHYGSCP